jgi:transglutaminase-like putative cysteine protease
MAFQIAAELRYQVHERSTVFLNLHALATLNQSLRNENFAVTPGVSCEFFPREAGENLSVRLDTGGVSDLLITYSVEVETHPDVRPARPIIDAPTSHFDHRALPYLFPSRYCQSDRLSAFAFQKFGDLGHPLTQVSAITDWIFETIDYAPGSSGADTSACDTIIQRAGVCRDFAHLGISLCRALSIPARYFSGYACDMQPPDFHACFEACIGNQWFVFDPTRLSSPNGLIRIATGRDAADTSTATIFGSIELTHMRVSCTADHFEPMNRADLEGMAVLLEP